VIIVILLKLAFYGFMRHSQNLPVRFLSLSNVCDFFILNHDSFIIDPFSVACSNWC